MESTRSSVGSRPPSNTPEASQSSAQNERQRQSLNEWVQFFQSLSRAITENSQQRSNTPEASQPAAQNARHRRQIQLDHWTQFFELFPCIGNDFLAQWEAVQNNVGVRPSVDPASASEDIISTLEGMSQRIERVHLEPPLDPARFQMRVVSSFHLKLPFSSILWSSKVERSACVRINRKKRTTQKPVLRNSNVESGPDDHTDTWVFESYGMRAWQVMDYNYIVVGLIGTEYHNPREAMVPVLSKGGLFKSIRKAKRKVVGPLRGMFSLKRVVGFSLYECVPLKSYHRIPELDAVTSRTLAELYRDFCYASEDHDDRWAQWVERNLNCGSRDPKNGKYAIRLILQWSPWKFVFWGAVPILLSLVIGLWYMIKPYPGEDRVAIVQTAWAISAYVVTTGALVIGILAAITQFGNA